MEFKFVALKFLFRILSDDFWLWLNEVSLEECDRRGLIVWANEAPIAMRQVMATLHHCGSGWKEQKLVTVIETEDSKKSELVMVHVLELGPDKVFFSRNDNEILLKD